MDRTASRSKILVFAQILNPGFRRVHLSRSLNFPPAMQQNRVQSRCRVGQPSRQPWEEGAVTAAQIRTGRPGHPAAWEVGQGLLLNPGLVASTLFTSLVPAGKARRSSPSSCKLVPPRCKCHPEDVLVQGRSQASTTPQLTSLYLCPTS